jgi:U3 small nucleolar RNA-associated protein 3
MGKRRNTARTGDKAIYNSRQQQQQQGRSSSSNKNKDKDDPMYNEIDRFHNERDSDFIRLGDDGGSDDGDDERALIGNKESVLDLGIGGDSSNEDEGDDEDDDDDENSLEHHSRKKKDSDSEESDDSSIEGELEEEDDDDDDDQQNIEQDPRRWGKKKSLYYHGDTADLEIGQEKEDAFLEEEAAKEIQASRFEEMDEDDFVLSDDDNNKDAGTAVTKEEGNGSSEQLSTVRDPTKLPKKAARKLLQGCYPGKLQSWLEPSQLLMRITRLSNPNPCLKHFMKELLPMVSYFSDIVSDLKDRTQVATSALMDGAGTAEVRPTPAGLFFPGSFVSCSSRKENAFVIGWSVVHKLIASVDASAEK